MTLSKVKSTDLTQTRHLYKLLPNHCLLLLFVFLFYFLLPRKSSSHIPQSYFSLTLIHTTFQSKVKFKQHIIMTYYCISVHIHMRLDRIYLSSHKDINVYDAIQLYTYLGATCSLSVVCFNRDQVLRQPPFGGGLKWCPASVRCQVHMQLLANDPYQ